MAGYEVVSSGHDWIRKETSLLARPGEVGSQQELKDELGPSIAQKGVRFLQDIAAEVIELSASRRIGVFGTAVAGAWVKGMIGDKISFFVDEDPAKIGTEFMGAPVLAPEDLPVDGRVYVSLPPYQAESIVERLCRDGIRCEFFWPKNGI